MDEASAGKPITGRRLERMASVLARRQPDVAVVLENVHDPHNVSAVLRSCDATGVDNVHLVYSQEEEPQLSSGVAAGTPRWLNVQRHADIASCYAALRAEGLAIHAATVDGPTADLYALDLAAPCALVFGNESRGLTSEAADLADGRLRIPMMGMAESLNISVACAVTLFEMLRQRRAAGRFDVPGYPEDHMRRTLATWLERDERDPSQSEQASFDPTSFPPVWPRTRPMPVSEPEMPEE
jgi:tRNA (guanosine-2'-O-)-methyltransferase